MVKLLVPASLEREFEADGRFAGSQAETVDDLAAALRLLAEGSDAAVFLGEGAPPLDQAAYRSVVASYAPLRQPVLVLSADARLIWANSHAETEGFSFENAPCGKSAELFEPASRHAFLRALERCVKGGLATRTIVRKGQASYEVELLPAGDETNPLVGAVLDKKETGAGFYERIARLARLSTNLFPEDAEALVRLPSDERLELIKALIEKAVKETFDYDDFILRALDDRTGNLEAMLVRSGTGANLSKRARRAGTEGGSVAGFVAATGEPYLVYDSSVESRWIQDLEEIHSAVVVPLKLGSKVVGTFAIEKREKFAFDYYDLMLATVFAGYVTAALDMANLVGLGQTVLVDRIAESVVEEVASHLENINESLVELRRHNVGDSIAVASRLESIRASASTIQEAILRGARKVGTAVAPPPPARPDEILAGKRVLVADDEPAILQSFGDILRSSGCEVVVARDGFEAVEMATSQPFDLVISDIKMPKMSGYEVYSSIKSKYPGTAVILMTAYGYDPTHSIVRARQEGLEAVLYKPFRSETLKKALRQALGRKEKSL